MMNFQEFGHGKGGRCMTVKTLLEQGVQKLYDAQIADADIDAMYLLEYVCGITRMDFLMNSQRKVSEKEEEKYLLCISRRASHVPLQYIIGSQEFMGFDFVVNEHVLIPRQDTEVLVEEVTKIADGKQVLDVCTGSGCIILSLCKMCSLTKAVGVDLSSEALQVASENGKRLECDVTFLESDLFDKVTGKYDVIVSNPPYIETKVIEGLMEEVREHEPHMALDGGEDGLDFYRSIVEQSAEYLNDGGYLCFEIGYNQGEAVFSLMEQKGFNDCRIVRDLAGLDRVVMGHWCAEHG